MSKGPLWIFFGTVRLFFENCFMHPKGPPSSFLIFCNGMYVNKSRRVPFYIFRHYATFFERKKFKTFTFFQNVLRFLSLRYSADFRCSRLVLSGHGYRLRKKISKFQFSLNKLEKNSSQYFHQIQPTIPKKRIRPQSNPRFS